jgi:hypothetical protein
MGQFFIEGGFGMFPVLLFGCLFVASAVLQALRPDRRLWQLVGWLGAMTAGGGVLGFSMGVINTSRYLEKVPAADQLQISMIGVAESLHNVVLAMVLLVIGAIAASVGGFRVSRRPA